MGVWGRGRSRHVESALYPVPTVRGAGEEVIIHRLLPCSTLPEGPPEKCHTVCKERMQTDTSCPDPVREALSDHEQGTG